MTHEHSELPAFCAHEVTQNQASDSKLHRPLFAPFGRKRGKLGAQAALRLETALPGLALPETTNRADLLRAYGADDAGSRLVLEIGFGNGQSLAALAAQHTRDCFIGVEVFLEGIAGLVGRLQQGGLTNVRIVPKAIHEVLSNRIPKESLDRVIINFPDPWPKKRHHKRRLVQADFLDLLASYMRPNAHLNLATDWSHYAYWMLEVLEKHRAFRNNDPRGGFSPEPNDWTETRFQHKAREAGRPTFHLSYQNRGLRPHPPGG